MLENRFNHCNLEFVMNRKSFIASALGVSFLIVSFLPTAASAYPPGTNVNLAASKTIFDWDNAFEPVFLNVANAGTSKVVVYVNGARKFGINPTNGLASWQFAPLATGRFTITAVVGSEKKTVVVYRPTRPIIYGTQKISKPFLVRTKYAKPGVPVTVMINGKFSSKIKVTSVNSGGFGTVYVPGNLLRSGSNTVKFLLGNLSYEKVVTGIK